MPDVDPLAFADTHLGAELLRVVPYELQTRCERGGRKVVALTFDDGPGEDTEAVVTILRQHAVPASFFVLGRAVEENMDALRTVVKNGHEIGVHSWSHPDLTTLTAAKLDVELRSTANIIASVTGVASRVMRPPYGYLNEATKAAAARNRLLPVDWSVDTSDWKLPETIDMPGVQELVRSTISRVRPCSIVLMHDGGGRQHPNTLAALPLLIERLKKLGFTFVTVTQLALDGPAE